MLGDPQYSYGYAKQVRFLSTLPAGNPQVGDPAIPDPHPGLLAATPRALAVARLGPEVGPSQEVHWRHEDPEWPRWGPDAASAAAGFTAAAPGGESGAVANFEKEAEDRGSAVFARRRCGAELRHGAGAESRAGKAHPNPTHDLELEPGAPDAESFSASTAMERLRNDRPGALRALGAQRNTTAVLENTDSPLLSAEAGPALRSVAGRQGSASRGNGPEGCAGPGSPSHDPDAHVEMCLWAVGLSFTHPFTGQLVTLAIPEPPAFEAARVRELHAWGAKHETCEPQA